MHGNGTPVAGLTRGQQRERTNNEEPLYDPKPIVKAQQSKKGKFKHNGGRVTKRRLKVNFL